MGILMVVWNHLDIAQGLRLVVVALTNLLPLIYVLLLILSLLGNPGERILFFRLHLVSLLPVGSYGL